MFQPILPLTGYAGWTFLERTLENQQSAFDKQASVSRATDYFRDSIGDIKTASDLVNDRQLLSVALGAFGLDDDQGLKDITSQSTSETAQWFTMMGTPPLRKVFETALGLPSSLARIDLDQQLSTFQDKSQAVFGTRNISDFLSGEKTQDLRRLFLIRSEAAAIQSNGAANIALTLLQSAPRLF